MIACNAAGLCVTASSDGVIPDNSPPSLGVVMDGVAEEDIQYQADGYFANILLLNGYFVK